MLRNEKEVGEKVLSSFSRPAFTHPLSRPIIAAVPDIILPKISLDLPVRICASEQRNADFVPKSAERFVVDPRPF